MFTTEYSVPSGWMRKACRFGMMHQLKLRYFVLLDKELRYYKYPVTNITPPNVYVKHKYITIILLGRSSTSWYDRFKRV